MTDSSDPRQPAPGNALATDPAAADTPEVYDPAYYRWVPFRRTSRFDGWTEEKQRRFIETLADTGLGGGDDVAFNNDTGTAPLPASGPCRSR